MERLEKRLRDGEVILLDGAIGTELQLMGAPMNSEAWCALALKSHPQMVRRLHEDYIRLGADVITTNTYSSARHNLKAAGYEEMTRELNTKAVSLAKEARDRASGGRAVYIAGSMSNYGAFAVSAGRPAPPVRQLKADYREQAELLAEAGVDLMLLEMVRDLKQGGYLMEAARATGLPVWLGFTCDIGKNGTVRLGRDEVVKRRSEVTFAQGIDALMGMGGSVVAVMHSEIENTTPALKVALEQWLGPVGAYPHSGFWVRPDWQFDKVISPKGYLKQAREWVEMGVQIVGGCCGIGRQHIGLLKKGLPSHVPPGKRDREL